MRKSKNTRKCKGCFQSILKTKENILENKYMQLGIDNNKKIIISEELNIQGMGKTLYLCRKEECINNAFKKRTIERYFNISLKDEEKEELKKYAKK